VLHTPLHWLAYWGDYRAIKQLLKHNQLDLVYPKGLCVNRYQFIEKYGAFNAFMSNNDQTPADIAGDLNNYQSLKAMIQYFKEEEDSRIFEAFLSPSIRSQFEASRFSNRFTRQHKFTKDDTPPQRVQVAFLKSKNFTKQQQSYIRLAYWAISMANMDEVDPAIEIFMKEFVYVFIIDLGISPFVKCYQNKSIVQACVLSRRLDFLRELLSHQYEVMNPKQVDIMAKTCQGKDIFGNNVFHEIFQLPRDTRNKYLEVIFDEKYHVKIYMRPQYSCCWCCKKYKIHDEEKWERSVQIGKFKKRNRLSFLPTDYEFESPIIVTPAITKKSKEVRKVLVESLEADFVIVTSEDRPGDQKCKLIENQLQDLGFELGKEYFLFVNEMDEKDKSGFQKYWIYFAIKFTNAKIAEVAHIIKVFGDLDVSNIRYQFNKHMKDAFQAFDARQRYTCIQWYLEQEIDFEHYKSVGIIHDAYPLHRLEAHKSVKKSVDKYWKKLAKNLVCGNWYKYCEPVHLMKKYYGERFSFYFLYFATYQAFLRIPAFLGFILFVYHMVRYASGEYTLHKSIDSPWNGVFGIFLCFWSHSFVQSWKSKEAKLIHEWDMDCLQDILINDERKGKFKWMWEYNSEVNVKMKMQIDLQMHTKYFHRFFVLVMSAATVATTFAF
jgi:hypothetical protein